MIWKKLGADKWCDISELFINHLGKFPAKICEFNHLLFNEIHCSFIILKNQILCMLQLTLVSVLKVSPGKSER